MALTCGFFNSYKGDRKYDAEQMSSIFDGILKDGIIPSYGQLFDVNSAQNGMQVTVGTGRAWFNHTWTLNDSVKILNVPESDITRPRYDAVVLEVNHEQDVRDNDIKIVTGVPAVNATKPTLVNTDKVKQYPLAYILVKAGVSEIKAEDIENMVGRTPTVFATGILETVAIDDLWSQWEGEWRTWFEGIKLQLSGDIVTNLQYQIDKLGERVDDNWVNTLSEYTKDLYGLSDSAVPDDIFQMLFLTAFDGQSLMRVTIVNSSGKPIPNVPIDITKGSGNMSISVSDKGTCIFKTVASESVTIKLNTNIIDLSGSITTTAASTGIREVTLQVTYNDFLFLTSSRSAMLSSECTKLDVSVCGGGGGGGGGVGTLCYETSGAGGGGGYVNIKNECIFTPWHLYSLTVGTGGTGGDPYGSTTNSYNGKSGGSSSAFGIASSGGSGGGRATNLGSAVGGSGNGGGGSGVSRIYAGSDEAGGIYRGQTGISGGDGSGSIFTSMTETVECGGGGGGGANVGDRDNSYYSGGQGGSPKGGNGASGRMYGASGSSGMTYGGGGGGSTQSKSGDDYLYGGSGGAGAIGLRMWH